MCHIVLFMPVMALPVFWLLPLGWAGAIYAAVALASAVLYWLIARSMGSRPLVGEESLIGCEAEVVSAMPEGSSARYLVRSQGELWTARSSEALEPGDVVNISAVRGVTLLVERNSHQAGAALRGRTCH